MSDVEGQELETTNDNAEITDETAPAEGVVTETTSDTDPAPGTDVEGVDAQASAEGEDGGDGDGDGEGEEEVPAYKPNVKFKAGVYNRETRTLDQKEYEIDKRFHGLMDTPENEKLVRELHEKAFGLDSVKERYAEAREQSQAFQRENAEIKQSIDDLRSTYQGAVRSGNYHKLDRFFSRLQIPMEVILGYAHAKVQLNEMDPTQQAAILGQVQAEDQAEEYGRLRNSQADVLATQARQIKELQTDHALASAEMSALVSEFDGRVGKPGAFREAIFRVGQYEWMVSKGAVDLTPQQAIQKVIEQYGLATPNPLVPGSQSNPAASGTGVPGKVAVAPRRPVTTLPNVSGRTASPLKAKPRSLDDLKKLYEQKVNDAR